MPLMKITSLLRLLFILTSCDGSQMNVGYSAVPRTIDGMRYAADLPTSSPPLSILVKATPSGTITSVE